jgi:hypothetical protein
MDLSTSVGAAEQQVVSKAKTWLGQPSTITGLATIASTVVSGALQALVHHTSVSAVGFAAVFALVHLVMNDNTASS